MNERWLIIFLLVIILVQAFISKIVVVVSPPSFNCCGGPPANCETDRANCETDRANCETDRANCETVVELEDFLTSDECDEIIRLAEEKGLSPSTIYTATNPTVSDTVNRISEQVWLLNSISESICKKIENISEMPIENQEEFQVVRYKDGGFFKPHFDYPEEYAQNESTKFNRYMTFLMYLNDDFEGGETYFPMLNRTIIPKKGKLVYFFNTDLEGNRLPDSLHEGKDIKGIKWICTKWVSSDPTGGRTRNL